MKGTVVKFTKMHGCGNDYIYVYEPHLPMFNPVDAAIRWSRFHTGIGSDGLILIGKSDVADFSMRIFNSDGSEAMMCGNGIRCVGKFVRDFHLTEASTVTVATRSGVKTLRLFENEQGEVTSAEVDMGAPVMENVAQLNTPTGGLLRGQLPAADSSLPTCVGTFVSMGNPHFVMFVDDVDDVDVAAIGRLLEHHPIFPEGCNIEFAQLRSDGSIRMRVWERGSGITMACGTGACATAVAAILEGRVGRLQDVIVEMDGGTLSVRWDETDEHVYMTGPAVHVYDGEISI